MRYTKEELLNYADAMETRWSDPFAYEVANAIRDAVDGLKEWENYAPFLMSHGFLQDMNSVGRSGGQDE